VRAHVAVPHNWEDAWKLRFASTIQRVPVLTATLDRVYDLPSSRVARCDSTFAVAQQPVVAGDLFCRTRRAFGVVRLCVRLD
jgi:hypothetical protein